MKQKDIALVVVVAVFALVVSVLISNTFISSSKNRSLTAEVVQPISTDFQQPDPRVFNKDAINPTQLIQIGDSSNPQPF